VQKKKQGSPRSAGANKPQSGLLRGSLVYSVYLAYFVYFIYLVYFVCFVIPRVVRKAQRTARVRPEIVR
jgi:hypothetical protein